MNLDALSGELNPPQLEAVRHTDGPLLVFAGAGSGKTRVITYRIGYILQTRAAWPSQILAVTFTNKAAGEMRDRLAKLVGADRSRGLWVSTFHALGAKLLRRYHARAGLRSDFAIYDDGDQRAVMKRVFDTLKLDDDVLPARRVLAAIDKAKQEVLSPADLEARARGPEETMTARAWAEYEERLRSNGAVDFGDLIARTVKLIETDETVREELRGQFRYVLVDEFQDTNNAQYRMLRGVLGAHRNLCVVGDDDQAIYRWRGADIRNIRNFRGDHPGAKVVKLEQNYRSTQTILRAANAVIVKAGGREAKTLFTRNGEGPKVEVLKCEDERDEARQVAWGVSAAVERGVSAREIAVFYRVNAQSRPLEEALRAEGIGYVIVGGLRFYERAEVKDILAYLRLLLNPNDDVSLVRVINTPARKIGKSTVERVQARAVLRGCSMWKIIATGDVGEGLGGAARKALVGFYELIAEMRKRAPGMLASPSELGQMVYEETGYERMLREKDEPEVEARRENIAELIGTMKSYEEETEEPSLGDWMERVTLAEETPEGEQSEKVSLMTVHSAKGLEFQKVFVTGMEDGMFPYKGMELGADPEEMEEERRLAYVAITRARQELTVSYARFRQIFGQTKVNGASRFLYELPEEILSQSVGRRGGGGAVRESARGYGTTTVKTVSFGERDSDSDGDGGDGGGIDDGPTLVRDELGSVRFRRGMRVKHPKFGPGTVKSVLPGAEIKVEVYFPAVGQTKVMLARFVEPL